MNLVSNVRAGQLFLAPHLVTEALECNHLWCKQLHLRNSDCESGFSPSPASNIYQHSCIVEGRERITENYHPGDYRAFLLLSQILLETNSTNGGLWEKKGLIFFFSSLFRSRSYSLAEAGLDFAVLLPAESYVCKSMLLFLPSELKAQSSLFYLALISKKCRVTVAVSKSCFYFSAHHPIQHRTAEKQHRERVQPS